MVTLTTMKSGQRGTVVAIQAGWGARRRLEVLGIRPGAKLQKVSSLFARGPVVVRVGTAEIALGYGLAEKVLVRVE